MGIDTIEINLVLALYYLGPYCTPALCSWSLHEHAHEALMSICAHECFMSMLMKLSRARAREGVTRTTTIGQYAPRENQPLPDVGFERVKACKYSFIVLEKPFFLGLKKCLLLLFVFKIAIFSKYSKPIFSKLGTSPF